MDLLQKLQGKAWFPYALLNDPKFRNIVSQIHCFGDSKHGLSFFLARA